MRAPSDRERAEACDVLESLVNTAGIVFDAWPSMSLARRKKILSGIAGLVSVATREDVAPVIPITRGRKE
jgi:hypothetical protein